MIRVEYRDHRILRFRWICLLLVAAALLISQTAYYALAGQLEPVCSSAVKSGDNIIVPIKVAGDKGEKIIAWGLDVDLKGLKYVGCTKSGCLAEGSSSFMCNQLSNGKVRCGSYTGELNIEGEHILFKLELEKTPNAKETSIQLLNFVDNLAGAKSSECKVK